MPEQKTTAHLIFCATEELNSLIKQAVNDGLQVFVDVWLSRSAHGRLQDRHEIPHIECRVMKEM